MYYLLLPLLATALAQDMTTIDPSVLVGIFGTPPPATAPPGVVTTPRFEDQGVTGKIDQSVLVDIFGPPPTTPNLQDITVRPTDATSNFVDENGDECKCVPYYLCDNANGIFADNVSLTGFGTLDIRFRGENDCQESVEKCCKAPKEVDQVVTPLPDVSRLRGCGYRNPLGIDFTITGGTGAEAQFGEFPWVVAILDALNSTYAGVGVLIHPQVVMTGAHIAHRYAPGMLKVRAGEWDTQTIRERLPYQERVAKDIYIHADFKPKSLRNDVALLLLDEPLQLSDHINVVCMPEQDEDFGRYRGCQANGWGKDSFGLQGRYAVILKRVEVDMVDHARCNMLLKRTRLGNNFKLHSSFVCAGGEEGKDTCQGDGGAPLVCPIGDDRYKLTGLVAWGIGCGQRDVPAVYAAVPRFRRWVDDKMTAWGMSTDPYTIQ